MIGSYESLDYNADDGATAAHRCKGCHRLNHAATLIMHIAGSDENETIKMRNLEYP